MDGEGDGLYRKDHSAAAVSLLRKYNKKAPCNILSQALYCNWLKHTYAIGLEEKVKI